MAHVPGACSCAACALARDRKALEESAEAQPSRPSGAMATPTYPPTMSTSVPPEPIVYAYGAYGVCGEHEPFWSGTRGVVGIASLLAITVVGAFLTAPAQNREPWAHAGAAESGSTRVAPAGTAWLGVSLEDVHPDKAAAVGLSPSEGAWVLDVAAGSPAARANIGAGDVICAIDGKPVSDAESVA